MSRQAVAQALAGLALIAVSWTLSWAGDGHARYHTFFPLWLGYILTVDALTRVITGTSLLIRLGRRFGWLFVLSVPLWWIFEAANARLENWVYVLPYQYGWLAYHLEASLAFSTVVPAVFVTAELARVLILPHPVQFIRIAPGTRGLALVMGAGLVMLLLCLVWPGVFFPLVWIGLFLICDPMASLAGGRSITAQVRIGRWDTVLVLFLATLTCGFFWEMWNSRALPRWEYAIPWADWLHIFEMPILGFGGYLPFGLEVYAFVSLADRLLGLGLAAGIRFDRTSTES